MIIWTYPDGSQAVTHVAQDVDEAKHAKLLHDQMPSGTTYLLAGILPSETSMEAVVRLQFVVQCHLDNKAKLCRYDTIHTACGWAGEFADASALKTWAAACWRKVGEIETAILSGSRHIPTNEEIIAELPSLTLP